jgi:hypothetical protein
MQITTRVLSGIALPLSYGKPCGPGHLFIMFSGFPLHGTNNMTLTKLTAGKTADCNERVAPMTAGKTAHSPASSSVSDGDDHFDGFSRFQTSFRDFEAGSWYLTLVRSDFRDRAGMELGCNPYAVAIQAWLLANPSSFASGRFTFDLGVLPIDHRPAAYFQGHVTYSRSDFGFSVSDFLSLGLSRVRLGMAAGAISSALDPAVLSMSDSRPSAMFLSPAPPPSVLHIPFAACISNGRYFKIALAGGGNFSTLMMPYESVLLQSFKFEAILVGQPTSSFSFAATTSRARPEDPMDWLSSPVRMSFYGSSMGPNVSGFELPADHPFGRELKAPHVGNPPPYFHFKFDGDAGESVLLRGTLSLRVGGVGVMTAVQFDTFSMAPVDPQPSKKASADPQPSKK